MHITKYSRSVAVVALACTALAGCSSLNSNKAKGGVAGAAVGGAFGAAIGRANGSTAKGAIIGAAVGGTVGAIIGHQMDQQAKELQQNIPGATVERVGEGIQVTFESGLLFDFNSDAVKPTAAQNLDNLAASLDKYPGSNLLIVGHTDAVGSDDYNQALSERRARSTALYLANRGVATSRLQTVGRGETEPVGSNDTEDGRAKNRRVEVAIYASDALKQQIQKQNP
jgi:outer membrane protein OmpA-like peptidoglycan-associated protein